jgi:integrase
MRTNDIPAVCPDSHDWKESMQSYAGRSADPTKILTRRELATVLADLRRKSPRSPSTRLNLIVFRLAACCGLRASEIARLQLADVHIQMPRPHLRIRASAAKGRKATNGATLVGCWDLTGSQRLEGQAAPAGCARD